MRWLRFKYKNQEYWGSFDENEIEIYTGSLFTHLEPAGERVGLGNIELLPVISPKRVLGIGLNYKEHIKELGQEVPKEPLVFYKDPASVITSGDIIYLPNESEQVEYEGEIGVVILKNCYKVPEFVSLDYIAGYVCANDVTARDLQKRDIQWYRSKSFKSFCPIGNILDDNKIWKNRRLRTYRNGEVVQDSNTNDMLFNVPKLISYISNFIEMEAQDVILTGTPAGVGRLNDGDVIEVEIEGIGKLKNYVKESEDKKFKELKKDIFITKPLNVFVQKTSFTDKF
ncbi:MAG: fumarylacetoacetate hydrolase family protein [Candidatus Hydrogenedentota bacterium]